MDPNIRLKSGQVHAQSEAGTLDKSGQVHVESKTGPVEGATTSRQAGAKPQLRSEAPPERTLLNEAPMSREATLADVGHYTGRISSATKAELPSLCKGLMGCLVRLPESDRAAGFHEAFNAAIFSVAAPPYRTDIMPLFCHLTNYCAILPEAEKGKAIESLIFLMDRQSALCGKEYSAENRVAGGFMLKAVEALKESLAPEQRQEFDGKLPKWRMNIRVMHYHFGRSGTIGRLEAEEKRTRAEENHTRTFLVAFTAMNPAIIEARGLDE